MVLETVRNELHKHLATSVRKLNEHARIEGLLQLDLGKTLTTAAARTGTVFEQVHAGHVQSKSATVFLAAADSARNGLLTRRIRPTGRVRASAAHADQGGHRGHDASEPGE